jgi:hypothetical protein
MERLFKDKCALTEEMEREEEATVVEYSDMKSDLKSELAKAMSNSMAKPKSGQVDKILSPLKKKVSLYEATCALTPNLNMLLDGLLTIRRTSTQNETSFSTSGKFVTKQ